MRAAASILAIALAGALAGCGGGEDPPDPPAAAADAADAVAIADFEYDPEAITVDAPTTLEFANADTASHTATADDESFDTGTLKRGDSAEIELSKPGTYSYYCRFHPFMKASVEVR